MSCFFRLIIIFLFTFYLVSCTSKSITIEQAYSEVIQDSAIINNTQGLIGEHGMSGFDIYRWAYFAYKADDTYFNKLSKIRSKNGSEWDEPIKKCDCKNLPKSDLIYWQKKIKHLKYDEKKMGKICYYGVIFPFVHIIYDDNSSVLHFVDEMKE